jgi:hypothetical protein
MEAEMHIGARVVLAAFFLIVFGGASWSDDPEPPLTQRQVTSILETEVAPGQSEKAPPPVSIKPLSEEDRKALKEEHRVIKGKNWRAETPQQRDQHIRNLRAANAPGTIFVIDVATGDVYKFPPLPRATENDRNKGDDARLSELYGVQINLFLTFDFEELPVAVGPSDDSQSNRSGRDFVVRGPPPKL